MSLLRCGGGRRCWRGCWASAGLTPCGAAPAASPGSVCKRANFLFVKATRVPLASFGRSLTHGLITVGKQNAACPPRKSRAHTRDVHGPLWRPGRACMVRGERPIPLVQESGVRPFHLSPGHGSHSALVPKMFLRWCFVLAGPESLDRPLESLESVQGALTWTLKSRHCTSRVALLPVLGGDVPGPTHRGGLAERSRTSAASTLSLSRAPLP